MQEVTYAELRARALIYVNNTTVSEAEWLVHINDAAKDYWNRINMTNQLYNVTEYSFVLQDNVATYDLPDDFLFVVAADIDKNGTLDNNSNNRVSVLFMPLEYRNYSRSQWATYSQSTGYGPFFAIILDNTQMLLQPVPQNTNFLFILRYVPYTPELTSDSSTINGINGFDVYISALAAKRVLDSRMQTNPSVDAVVANFQEYLQSGVMTRNRAMRTPIIDRAIGPYSSYTGYNGS